jgi:lysophospholipase L1-like esterase
VGHPSRSLIPALPILLLPLLAGVAGAESSPQSTTDEVCLAGFGGDAGSDQIASAVGPALVDQLEQLGPACAPTLVRLLQESPSGWVNDLVLEVARAWSASIDLGSGFYGAFGQGALAPYGRKDDVVFGAARVIEALSPPGADLLDPVRAGCCADWPALALARYQLEWQGELVGAGPPPGDDETLVVASSQFARCLDDPTGLPPDPFDPLGLRDDAAAELLVATRCASWSVVEAWLEVGSEDWRAQIVALMGRFEEGELPASALDLERAWGQGEGGNAAAAATAIPWSGRRSHPRALAAIVGLAALALLLLLARSERGRPWALRLGAIVCGLALVVVAEGLAWLVGVPPGDALRPGAPPRALDGGDVGHFEDQRFRSFAVPPPPGTARVAVLGASSVAGANLAEHETITGRLRALLEPEVPCVEVVNLGFHGLPSTGLRPAAIEAAGALGADLVIVYAGHNEVGDMREQDRYLGFDPRGHRLRSAVVRTHLFGLGGRLLGFRERLVEEPQVRLTEEGPPDRSPEAFEAAVNLRFERELRDLVRGVRRRGSRVALAVPSFNHHGLTLPWWKPEPASADLPRTDALIAAILADEPTEAVRLGERMVELDPEHPSAWFLLSLAREAAGDLQGAETAIWEASRLHRGGSTVLPEVAGVAIRLAREYGLPLLDAHAALHRASGDHLPGNDLFLDAVHLNPRGARVVAEEMAAGLRRDGVTDELAARCRPDQSKSGSDR